MITKNKKRKMSKGVDPLTTGLFIMGAILVFEGIFLTNAIYKIGLIRRVVRETDIIEAVNFMEDVKRGMHDAVAYSLYQASYDVLEKGGFCEHTLNKSDPEYCDEGCKIPSEVPTFECTPWWYIYGNRFDPIYHEFKANLTNRTYQRFEEYAEYFEEIAPNILNIPSYCPRPEKSSSFKYSLVEEPIIGATIEHKDYQGNDLPITYDSEIFSIFDNSTFSDIVDITVFTLLHFAKQQFTHNDYVADVFDAAEEDIPNSWCDMTADGLCNMTVTYQECQNPPYGDVCFAEGYPSTNCCWDDNCCCNGMYFGDVCMPEIPECGAELEKYCHLTHDEPCQHGDSNCDGHTDALEKYNDTVKSLLTQSKTNEDGYTVTTSLGSPIQCLKVGKTDTLSYTNLLQVDWKDDPNQTEEECKKIMDNGCGCEEYCGEQSLGPECGPCAEFTTGDFVGPCPEEFQEGEIICEDGDPVTTCCAKKITCTDVLTEWCSGTNNINCKENCDEECCNITYAVSMGGKDEKKNPIKSKMGSINLKGNDINNLPPLANILRFQYFEECTTHSDCGSSWCSGDCKRTYESKCNEWGECEPNWITVTDDSCTGTCDYCCSGSCCECNIKTDCDPGLCSGVYECQWYYPYACQGGVCVIEASYKIDDSCDDKCGPNEECSGGSCVSVCECTPGETKTCTSGEGCDHTIECGADCKWPSCPIDECTPGQTTTCIGTEGCEHTITCNNNCEWPPCPEDECYPMSTCIKPCTYDSGGCGGSMYATCMGNCQCSPYGSCSTDGESCGNCGTCSDGQCAGDKKNNGESCSNDNDCCSGNCCDNICSATSCTCECSDHSDCDKTPSCSGTQECTMDYSDSCDGCSCTGNPISVSDDSCTDLCASGICSGGSCEEAPLPECTSHINCSSGICSGNCKRMYPSKCTEWGECEPTPITITDDSCTGTCDYGCCSGSCCECSVKTDCPGGNCSDIYECERYYPYDCQGGVCVLNSSYEIDDSCTDLCGIGEMCSGGACVPCECSDHSDCDKTPSCSGTQECTMDYSDSCDGCSCTGNPISVSDDSCTDLCASGICSGGSCEEAPLPECTSHINCSSGICSGNCKRMYPSKCTEWGECEPTPITITDDSCTGTCDYGCCSGSCCECSVKTDCHIGNCSRVYECEWWYPYACQGGVCVLNSSYEIDDSCEELCPSGECSGGACVPCECSDHSDCDKTPSCSGTQECTMDYSDSCDGCSCTGNSISIPDNSCIELCLSGQCSGGECTCECSGEDYERCTELKGLSPSCSMIEACRLEYPSSCDGCHCTNITTLVINNNCTNLCNPEEICLEGKCALCTQKSCEEVDPETGCTKCGCDYNSQWGHTIGIECEANACGETCCLRTVALAEEVACKYEYFGSANISVKVSDEERSYPIEGEFKNLEFPFYVVSGNVPESIADCSNVEWDEDTHQMTYNWGLAEEGLCCMASMTEDDKTTEEIEHPTWQSCKVS